MSIEHGAMQSGLKKLITSDPMFLGCNYFGGW